MEIKTSTLSSTKILSFLKRAKNNVFKNESSLHMCSRYTLEKFCVIRRRKQASYTWRRQYDSD